MTMTCLFLIYGPFLFLIVSLSRGRNEDPDVWFAAIVSAPRLRSVILYLPVMYADLKIYLEDGGSGFKIHLYDHLCGSPTMTVDMERQSSRLTLSIKLDKSQTT